MTPRPAVFLDRDGTLVEDPGFQRNPDAVRLLPGVAAAVARLNAAGFATVVVTNQSGIARGLISAAEYDAVERRIAGLFAAAGARIDATYHCPHHPEVDGPCECRKPGTLLYRRAARDLGLDLTASWGVGDRLSDLEPVRTLGGRALLVRSGTGAEHEEAAAAAGYVVVDDLAAAVERILKAGHRAATP
jgi:histidinol-phosphate phosphatase family protein